MLSERDLQLLTAFVDGELTKRQRKVVLRLLHRSSEARSVLQDFQEAAHRIQELPPRKLGDDFAQQVLRAITDRGLQPTSDPKVKRVRDWSRLARIAVAASIVIGFGLAVYFATLPPSNNNLGQVAETKPVPSVEKATSFQATFQELAEKPKQELLAKQIQKETAVHLEVTVRDNTTAVAQLQKVLTSKGIQVIVDGRAQAKLDNKEQGQGKVEYLVYAENVRTEELEMILRQLADVPNNQAIAKNPFEAFVLTSLSTPDRQNLSGLLGVEPAELENPKRNADPKLFDDTIIAAPKDKAKKTTPAQVPNLDRFAMVLANDSAQGQPSSAEIARFLAGRRQQQPGTVQVLFVIRRQA